MCQCQFNASTNLPVILLTDISRSNIIVQYTEFNIMYEVY